MKMSQRPYLNDRLIEDKQTGYVVITPIDAEQLVPFACCVCSYVMKTSDDEVAYNEFECCDACAQIWARPRRQAWSDGWRPSEEQLRNAALTRVPRSLTINIV